MIRLALVSLVLASLSFAQATTPQTPPPGAQQSSTAGNAQSQSAPGMRHPRMGTMQSHMRAQMQAQTDQMQKLLDQLKSDSASIQDSAGKKVADDNVALWQALVDHMKQMGSMMGAARRMPSAGAIQPKQPQ